MNVSELKSIGAGSTGWRRPDKTAGILGEVSRGCNCGVDHAAWVELQRDPAGAVGAAPIAFEFDPDRRKKPVRVTPEKRYDRVRGSRPEWISMVTAVHPIILYDGVCGLCDRFNRFAPKRDRQAVFRFAALQSRFAREILGRHGANADDLDTVYVIIDHGMSSERLVRRGRAVLYVLQRTGWPWRMLTAFGVLPAPLLDLGYRMIARTRYRLFGRHDECVLPESAWRERYIAAE